MIKKSRALKAERNGLDEQQGERVREENLRARIAVESRIRSAVQGRMPSLPL
jgi:hypothetical protein